MSLIRMDIFYDREVGLGFRCCRLPNWTALFLVRFLRRGLETFLSSSASSFFSDRVRFSRHLSIFLSSSLSLSLVASSLTCLPVLSTFVLAFPRPPYRQGSSTPARRGVARAAFVRRASVKVKRRKSGFEDEPSNLLLVDIARDRPIEALSRGPRESSVGFYPSQHRRDSHFSICLPHRR